MKETIELVKPDTVMVELCPGRAERLRSGGTSMLKELFGVFQKSFAPGASIPGGFGASIVELFMKSFYK